LGIHFPQPEQNMKKIISFTIIFCSGLFVLLNIKTVVLAKAPSIVLSHSSLQQVSFISQAPTGNWSDLRQEDGCEEATTFIAVTWSKKQILPKGKRAETALTKIANWEQAIYKNYHDTSIKDTANRILKVYFNFANYQVRNNVTVTDIITELSHGNIIIAPMDGTKLGNPNFKKPGPPHHMLVIIGFNAKTNEFITNDPGTRNGTSYLYAETTIDNAWRDYPTGQHLPTIGIKKDMIVIRPSNL
jgi:hypothetical protein